MRSVMNISVFIFLVPTKENGITNTFKHHQSVMCGHDINRKRLAGKHETFDKSKHF